jgi:hypothetical protein
MTLETLNSTKSQLASVDRELLNNAVDLGLAYTAVPEHLADELSNFETLEYLSNTACNEFTAVSLNHSKDLMTALDIDEMFDFGVTRMCFAVNIVAKKGQKLFPSTGGPNKVAEGLKELEANPRTQDNIDNFCEDTIASSFDLKDNGLASVQPYAKQYGALHNLAFETGNRARQEFKDSKESSAYPFAVAGGIAALGIIGKLIDVAIEDETQRHGVSKEWLRFIEGF